MPVCNPAAAARPRARRARRAAAPLRAPCSRLPPLRRPPRRGSSASRPTRRKSRSAGRCTRRSCRRWASTTMPSSRSTSNSVGQKLAQKSNRPKLQYTFTVLDTEDVNAFAIPGGFVYISRGILPYLSSEAELAAVLGHEIGHVTARHGPKQQTQGTLANIAGIATAILTGQPALAQVSPRSPATAITGLRPRHGARGRPPRRRVPGAHRLRPERVIARGPHAQGPGALRGRLAPEAGGARAAHLSRPVRHAPGQRHAPAAGGRRGRKRRRPCDRQAPRTRSSSCGISTGSPGARAREQGVVRGSRMYHAGMGFTVAFPSGWDVENGRSASSRCRRRKDSLLMLQTAPIPPKLPSRALRRPGAAGRAHAARPEELEINGLPALHGRRRRRAVAVRPQARARGRDQVRRTSTTCSWASAAAPASVPDADRLFVSSAADVPAAAQRRARARRARPHPGHRGAARRDARGARRGLAAEALSRSSSCASSTGFTRRVNRHRGSFSRWCGNRASRHAYLLIRCPRSTARPAAPLP